MKYTIDKQEKYSLLRLHEEKLDSNVAPALKSELITLHAEGIRNIILDLAEVKYTDSSGLSALLVGNRILQEDGGRSLHPNTKRVDAPHARLPDGSPRSTMCDAPSHPCGEPGTSSAWPKFIRPAST